MTEIMPAAIVKSSVIVASQGQTSCDLPGEVAILNVNSGMYYGLDAVGARVWHLIQEPKTVNEVLVTLLEEYEVDPNRCEEDLLSLLRELAAHGVIQVQSEKEKSSGVE